MGGNATATMKDGTVTHAEKIPIANIGRSKFMEVVRKFLTTLNKKFERATGKLIWVDEKIIISGMVFNGSTSFIMDPTIADKDIIKVKPVAGDVDVIVPQELKEDLWNFLSDIEGEAITRNVIYMGSNKPTLTSVGDQINAIFLCEFGNIRCNCQVDFEFLPYENSQPTEWAKFSHSSSFSDAKLHIKAVHHKYLIRAMIGSSTIRKDIVICTPASTPDHIKLSKAKEHLVPRMLRFSVSRGMRTAYEPLLDKNGEQVYVEDKAVFRAIPTTRSNFITSVTEIFRISFGDPDPTDINKFSSFIGVVDLMKKYLTKEQIKNTINRYMSLLWHSDPNAQELEKDNPQLDFEVKNAGYQYIIKKLKIKDTSADMVKKYYANYGQRKEKLPESFLEWLDMQQVFLLPDEEL